MAIVMAPFTGKAFHIDDPLFVWAAKHIAQHPFDFYGFEVLWYSTWERMADVTQNPPLGCYYLALVGSVSGWSEHVLHWAMLLPAWAALAGTYRIAERLGAQPLISALLTLCTPVFVLSATSVMCDLPMLALWLWTIIFWDEGLRERSAGRLWLAGILISVTTLTKYFGICLLPLLAAYSLVVDRPGWRRWLPPLALAVVILIGYQVLTWWLYGRGLLGWAMGYAASSGSPSIGTRAFRLCAGLAFLGGCIGAIGLAVPFVIGRSGRLGLVVTIGAVLALSLFLTGKVKVGSEHLTASPFTFEGGYSSPRHLAGVPASADEIFNWAQILGQFVLWATLGSAIAILCWQDYRRERDSRALLLGLWIGGTFVFAAFVNWTLNGRSILPLVPAVAIVMVRRLTLVWGDIWPRWAVASLLAPSLTLSFIVAHADMSAADAQRAAASRIAREFAGAMPLWFAGHWGFQYYMMEQGAAPWDGDHDRGQQGQLIAIPDNNCNIAPFKWTTENVIDFEDSTRAYATTMHYMRAAGFYAEAWGPLPFTFGPVPPESFRVERLVVPKR
jgi:4-amino-4-deoxy-L-arabinose transferase-like glycosyltransferase